MSDIKILIAYYQPNPYPEWACQIILHFLKHARGTGVRHITCHLEPIWHRLEVFLQTTNISLLMPGTPETLHKSISKTILHGILEGGQRHDKQTKCWMDNTKEWTSLPIPALLTKACRRKDWETISADSSIMFPIEPNHSKEWTELNCWGKHGVKSTHLLDTQVQFTALTTWSLPASRNNQQKLCNTHDENQFLVIFLDRQINEAELYSLLQIFWSTVYNGTTLLLPSTCKHQQAKGGLKVGFSCTYQVCLSWSE